MASIQNGEFVVTACDRPVEASTAKLHITWRSDLEPYQYRTLEAILVKPLAWVSSQLQEGVDINVQASQARGAYRMESIEGSSSITPRLTTILCTCLQR